MATFSVIVSGDRDSNSTHAACVLVEARNCSDSCFCFRCLKVGAEHSQLSAHGWSRSSERKEQVFGFHGLSDAPNTHFVHSVADFNNLHTYLETHSAQHGASRRTTPHTHSTLSTLRHGAELRG